MSNPTPEETVTIPKRDYNSLLEDELLLGKLFAAGVDNWEGYHVALQDDEPLDKESK
jgi:hypothetical protein